MWLVEEWRQLCGHFFSELHDICTRSKHHWFWRVQFNFDNALLRLIVTGLRTNNKSETDKENIN